jgi:hypothetical protein
VKAWEEVLLASSDANDGSHRASRDCRGSAEKQPQKKNVPEATPVVARIVVQVRAQARRLGCGLLTAPVATGLAPSAVLEARSELNTCRKAITALRAYPRLI